MILGLGDATTAAIVGPLIVAMLGGLGAAIKIGFRIRDELVWLRDDQAHRIGTPNGKGNAIQMLETIVSGQAGQDNRLAKLETTVGALRTDVGVLSVHSRSVDETLHERGERIGIVEQELAVLKGAPCMAPTPVEISDV